MGRFDRDAPAPGGSEGLPEVHFYERTPAEFYAEQRMMTPAEDRAFRAEQRVLQASHVTVTNWCWTLLFWDFHPVDITKAAIMHRVDAFFPIEQVIDDLP